ncbi:LysE family translocator [Streptomyces resistomycificus]|uniref:Lysine transporter LysE n=1 Tax=Streptomyces resistomycificus TaxID=67356 RepID=A0A0L8LFR2_9ACTN|nr:LysE family translocator [Streptomyces resistomycificus]KOG36955.1 lysine transporter LysE [Streptomyces resistomycificus]KUN96574.1 lysine transporter LysE [Streptomyces resistomycificus]
MHSGTLISFLAVDLLLVCVPGADWAYAISAGLRDRSPVVAVAGLVSGYALHTVLAVAGLAVLVARSPGLLTALTAAGAAYLVWLGWGLLRRPGTPDTGAPTGSAESAESAGEPVTPSPARVFLRGATISGLNPKGLLLYLSVLPQFLVTGGGHLPVAAQTAVFGLLHMACCAAVYLTVGLAARAVLGARPAAARAVTRTSGAAMLGIGTLLLVQRLATL